MIELNKIYNEDCLEGMKRIEDKSIDMILCDLPYGTTACKWDVVIPFDKLWEQYKRIIKDNGVIVLFGSQPFTTDLINSNRKHFRYELIWNKVLGRNFMSAKKQPLKAHENICVFYKLQPNYNPQKLEKKNIETIKREKREKKNRCFNKASSEHFNNLVLERSVHEGEYKYPVSIIECKQQNISNQFIIQSFHPTQKPVALCEYLIKTYTNENELVLDNCIGSGTTAVACINTNRNYIGFEKEKKYFDIANKRIEEAQKQLKLMVA